LLCNTGAFFCDVHQENVCGKKPQRYNKRLEIKEQRKKNYMLNKKHINNVVVVSGFPLSNYVQHIEKRSRKGKCKKIHFIMCCAMLEILFRQIAMLRLHGKCSFQMCGINCL
jgi:hypothetical protein